MSKVSAVIVNFQSNARTQKLVGGLKRLEEIGGIEIVDNSFKNRGFARAVNLGIENILFKKPNKLLLINPDVEIEAESFKEFLSGDSADITAPIIAFKRKGRTIYDLGGKVNLILGRAKHIEMFRDSGQARTMKDIDYVSGACMLVRREVFEKIGLFDERFFMYFEDVDFCLRAKGAGFTVDVDSNVLVTHDLAEHRYSGNVFKKTQAIRSNASFIKKWTPKFCWPVAYFYWMLLYVTTMLKKNS